MNHHFFGDVSAWFISFVAGIKINPNFFDCNSVEIAPSFIDKLSFAESKVRHEKGEIFVRWEREKNGNIKIVANIPNGVSAKLVLEKGWTCNEDQISPNKVIVVTKI